MSRFVPTLSADRAVTRPAGTGSDTGQRGAGVSTSAGVYHNPCRTTEQSSSNPVDMLIALFVFCSFLFGNVRSVFVLKISLKACKCAEYCACSFCSVKKRDTPDLQDQSKNVVGGVFKCGQKLYTWKFTSHNINRGRNMSISPRERSRR